MPPHKDFSPRTRASTTPPEPHQIPPDVGYVPPHLQGYYKAAALHQATQAGIEREVQVVEDLKLAITELHGEKKPPVARLTRLPVLPQMRDLDTVFPAMTNRRHSRGEDVPLLWAALWLEETIYVGDYLPGQTSGGRVTIWQQPTPELLGLPGAGLEDREVLRNAFGIPIDIQVRVSKTKTYGLTSWLACLVDFPPGQDYCVVRLPNELEIGLVPISDVDWQDMGTVRQTLIREIGYGILDDDEIEQMRDPSIGRTVLTRRFWDTVRPRREGIDVDFDEWLVTEMTMFQTQQEMKGIR